ncbi:MAG: proprotein convertase P-domain-containing protein [Acidobacteriota bacterium]
MKVAVLAIAAGCSFHHGSYEGAVGDGLPPGDHWIFDTASDFAGAGYVASAIDIEPAGALTPTGYVYGALLEHGLQGTELWNTADTNPQWSDTTAVTPSGAGLWDGQYTSTSDSYANVGVTTNDVFSLWFEGEIYVDANDELMLDADGAGFVDLLGPSGWTTVVASRSNGQQTSSALPAAGWYTIRMGYGEGTASGHLDFRHGPAGSFVPFTRDRLRADTSSLAGTLRSTFARQLFGGASGDGLAPVMQLAPDALLAQTNLTPAPPGAGAIDWSARWSGQLHVATAGSYTIAATSDAGNRLAIAGGGAGSHWVRGDSTPSTTTVTADLIDGWNDLVLDYTHVSGTPSLSLAITAAPDQTTGPIAADRLRVVEPRRDRLIVRSVVASSPITIANDSGVPATLAATVAAFPSELVGSLEVTVRLSTQHENQLVFYLTPPGGSPIAIQTHGGGDTQLGTAYVTIPVTSGALLGGAAAGTWTLGVADDVTGGNASTLQELHLTLHTHGGPEQIAIAGTWTSPVRDFMQPVRVTDVSWTERAPLASNVYVRACDAADCSDQPDFGVPVADHSAPALAARRYLQARVTMYSDGTVSPELDQLAITYLPQ